jgi:hypothetical protein
LGASNLSNSTPGKELILLLGEYARENNQVWFVAGRIIRRDQEQDMTIEKESISQTR